MRTMICSHGWQRVKKKRDMLLRAAGVNENRDLQPWTAESQ